MFYFYTRSKRQKTFGYLKLSGGVEIKHRPKIGCNVQGY